MKKRDYLAIDKAFSLFSQKRNIPDNVPEGWYTNLQLCSETRRSRATIDRMVDVMTKEGMCETKTFMIMTKSGFIRPIPHYKFYEKKKENSKGLVQ